MRQAPFSYRAWRIFCLCVSVSRRGSSFSRQDFFLLARRHGEVIAHLGIGAHGEHLRLLRPSEREGIEIL